MTIEQMELYFWMLKNCNYYEIEIADLPSLVNDYATDPIPLEVAVSYIPGFHVDKILFEKKINASYSYKTHLLPLVEEKLIYCGNYEGYTEEERDRNDQHWACVRDYEKNISYIRFWLGCHPEAKGHNDGS